MVEPTRCVWALEELLIIILNNVLYLLLAVYVSAVMTNKNMSILYRRKGTLPLRKKDTISPWEHNSASDHFTKNASN